MTSTMTHVDPQSPVPSTRAVCAAPSFLRWRRLASRCAAALACASLPLLALAQPALQIKPLAEKKVDELPAGDLFWRIETMESAPQASAAAGTWTLVVEAAGKAWQFTLGPLGAPTAPGASKVAEVGPIPRVAATRYLLRINEASGPPGSTTPVHTHPGSEAFFVLAGEQSIRSASGVLKVRPGQAEAGQGADHAMQVSSSGAGDLRALVMFVVDANRPFSSPATLP
jgi:quercetin dioxygenase-like cupin family protein